MPLAPRPTCSVRLVRLEITELQGDRLEDAHSNRGEAVQQRVELAVPHDEQPAIRDSRAGRGALSFGDEGDVAEEATGPERGKQAAANLQAA